jgi:predicted TIM-barrel fold metal-dependent hydrolase
MAGFDVHQHLWPAAFREALAQRTEPPYLDGDVLHVSEGASTCNQQDHELATRLALLDLHEIETAVVSLQPTLGLETLDSSERDRLVGIWEDGIVELAAAAPGRIVPLAVSRPREGFAGVSIGADRLDALEDLAPTLDALRGDGLLFVHPVAGDPPASAPAWWSAVIDYTSQMQRAYFAWLVGAQERWPDVTVVFAILAGGGPIQLERLSSRGAEVRSSLHRNLFFDTASYGRRALELCIETYGVEQLVFGTDTPIVDPTPAIRAVDAFGESVARLVRQDNLIGWNQ